MTRSRQPPLYSRQQRAVVIDDKQAWRTKIRRALEGKGFEVDAYRTGKDGLRRIRQQPRPALVILDFELRRRGDIWGDKVLAAMKADSSLQRVPVLMLSERTNAAAAYSWKTDEYLEKENFDEFGARVDALMARAANWPFDSEAGRTLSVSVRPQAPVDVMVGVIELREQAAENLDLDVERFAMRGRAAHGSLPLVMDFGDELYARLTKGEIGASILKAVDNGMRVNIAGSQELIGVPLEFLRRGSHYFVLTNPFSRSIVDLQARPSPPSISPKMLNDLCRRKEGLKVLLIASNTGGIAEVEREVRQIRAIFRKTLPAKGIDVEITLLTTRAATKERIRQEIATGYHIVHYAGHGWFDEGRPGKSSLLLHGKGGSDVERLTAGGLQHLWPRGKPPSLLYISSCSGAASGGRRDLLYNDVLGLAHGAVAAGVPTVLGFRWPVLDPCARLLATSFYKALLETGRPDEALRTARLTVREEYEDTKYEDDQAWLSPVLIMQP